MIKTFAQHLKSRLVFALAILLSIPLFSVATKISWSAIDKIAELILIKQIFGPNSGLLFELIIFSIFAVSIPIVYKTSSKAQTLFTGSESTSGVLKESAAFIGFIILLGLVYPFMVEVLSVVMDWLFNLIGAR
jgi:hypothetical protein